MRKAYGFKSYHTIETEIVFKSQLKIATTIAHKSYHTIKAALYQAIEALPDRKLPTVFFEETYKSVELRASAGRA